MLLPMLVTVSLIPSSTTLIPSTTGYEAAESDGVCPAEPADSRPADKLLPLGPSGTRGTRGSEPKEDGPRRCGGGGGAETPPPAEADFRSSNEKKAMPNTTISTTYSIIWPPRRRVSRVGDGRGPISSCDTSTDRLPLRFMARTTERKGACRTPPRLAGSIAPLAANFFWGFCSLRQERATRHTADAFKVELIAPPCTLSSQPRVDAAWLCFVRPRLARRGSGARSGWVAARAR